MRLLIVAPRFPYPLDKGDRLTIYNIVRYFSKRHVVDLASFLEPDQGESWIQHLSPFCSRVEIVPLNKTRAYWNCLAGILGPIPFQVLYYRDPFMHDIVHRLCSEHQYDLLYAHTIRMGQYIVDFRDRPRVLAMQISMALHYRRMAAYSGNILWRLLYALEHRKVKAYEPSLGHRFDRVLLISPTDWREIEKTGSLDNVFFNPHGVDFVYFSPDKTIGKEPASIIFTGNMSYPPNVDAVLHFCKSILPLIQKQVPEVKFYIVGTSPTPEVKALGKDRRIIVTGSVDDLRIYMNKVQVAVDPLRIGAGLQNKVLEGMSMELPMVITSVANEGIGTIDGENVLIADDPRSFADKVISLLRDPTLRFRTGNAAREFIVANWSWEKHFRDLEGMLESLVNGK